ncbi:MAG: sigma-70 family RNA polymerase sigma factor [Candidatus Latescibacteria bacterium]|nr:sigma-70 family RNA polymerase sigma factor [Candidatus Latescibacterota bacterium]
MNRDRDLVERSLRGELRAFSALVDRYRYAVFGLCLGHTRDADTAEDMTQEAFIKAFLKLRELADPDRFAPWLRRMAINECRMWHRRRPDQISLSEAEMEAVAGQAPSPEDERVSREVRQTVLAAVGQLSEPQQQVVTLFYLEELSLDQIAAFLGISPQTANQRLYRARRQLKQEMLNMVEETLGKQKLPKNFTEEVITAALQRGRQLLEAQRWPEAKAEFRKVVSAVPDHLDAQRGLALALNGETREMMKGDQKPLDKKLLLEGLSAHEEAYRLGARDQETVWNLAELYSDLDRDAERARFLETYAAETDDPEQKFRALRQVCISYRGGDNDRAFAFHRKALAVEGIPPKERLIAYFGPPARLYCFVGQADLWLTEAEALYPHLGMPLTDTHYTYYRDQITTLGWLGKHREVVQAGRRYLELLEKEAVTEPIQCRWWISDTWALLISRGFGPLHDEEGMRAALQIAQDNLRAYDAEWQSAVARETDTQRRRELDSEYRRFFEYAISNLGVECREAGLFEEAILLMERGLKFREGGYEYLHLAIAHMQKGDHVGALEVLRRMYQSAAPRVKREIFLRVAKGTFYNNPAFASVQEDAAFLELIESTPTV